MISRYASSRIRLDEWRKYRAKYPSSNPEPLPPNWFGAVAECTPTRDERGARYHYGEGLGVDVSRSRPFRFVGYADEVCKHIRHTGWYGDDEGTGFSVLRGVVLQIPARGGNPQYLAGYEWGENGARGSFSAGGGMVEIGRGDIYESAEDAARAADSLAQYAAEEEREERREEEERMREEEAEREREEAENEAERLALADIPPAGAD